MEIFKMKGISSLFVLVLFNVMVIVKGFSDDNHGIDTLNYLLQNDHQSFCHYVKCQENVAKEECPEGTQYLEGVAQFGCCGACVRFMQFDEGECTGSIDPKYGGGYTRGITSGSSFLESLSAQGNISMLLPQLENTLYSSWCDYYLLCGKTRKKCESNPADTGCRFVQSLYDQALANPNLYVNYRDDYRWRPNCTTDGNYAEKQCKGPLHESRCVCVDPLGKRLYGSAFEYQKELYKSMNCKCSRRVWERQKAGESSVTLHCAENGNYEALQCEKGWCYCIDPSTALPYGPNLPAEAMNLLPCYNKTFVGQQYLRRCESEYHAHSTLKALMAYKNVQGPTTRLKCDPDGSYNGIQCDNTMCRCFTKYHDEPISYPAGEGCQCVRDRVMFSEDGVNIEITCAVNSGTYEELQLKGTTVSCVDEDGVRNGPLVYSEYKDYLDCLSGKLCQSNSMNCDKTCVDCPSEAYVKYKPEESLLGQETNA